MAREEPLTEDEMRELVHFREHIISRATSTEPIDHAKAEKAYNALLVQMGHKPVTDFVWFDSPYNMHKKMLGKKRTQLGISLRLNPGISLRINPSDHLGDHLEDQLGSQIADHLRDQIGIQIADQLGIQIADQLWDQIGSQIADQIDQWQLQYWAWMEYASELHGVVVDQNKLETLKLLSKLGEHAFWILPLKNGAAFCERPTRLVMRSGRLDYDHDAAIEFKDGWKHYYLNGVHLDEQTWSDIVNERITLENLGKITDADVRAVAVQYLRADCLLEQVKAELIDTGKRGVELYRVPNFMDTGDTEYCMKLEHPSVKGKFYIEWVEPKTGKKGSADHAMAVSRNLSLKQYLAAALA